MKNKNKQTKFSKKKILLFSIITFFISTLIMELFSSFIFFQFKSNEKFASVFIIKKIRDYSINKNINGLKKERYIRLKEHKIHQNYKFKPTLKKINCKGCIENKVFEFNTDKNGFIKPSEIYENPDLKIVFLGGSTTECSLVEEKKRFPYLVGRIVEKETKLKINSYNSGVSGNNAIHSINILLNKLVVMNPDYVFLLHNINDLFILLYEGSYWNNNAKRSQIIDYNNPNFLKNWKDEFFHIRGKKLVVNREFIKKEFEKSLNLFISISKNYGIKPILMTQANRFTDNPDKNIFIKEKEVWDDLGLRYKEIKEIYDILNRSIVKLAKKENILLIDLNNDIPKTDRYIYDLVHYTNKGSILTAKVISDKLTKHIKN